MELPLSRQLVSRLVSLGECASTNSELLARASAPASRQDWPDFSVIVTTNQTSGRGRLGREWMAPPGQGLAVSVLLRPALPEGGPLSLENYGWLPLIAGLAMTRAVTGLVAGGNTPHTPPSFPSPNVSMKWPNDVLIDGRKVSGLLAELLPSGDGVVLGAGLNLTIAAADLPTPVSTSLSLHGVTMAGNELVDAALAGYLRELRIAYTEFVSSGADPDACGIRSRLNQVCSTFGQRVRVELPGGGTLFGTATGVDRAGRLQVTRSDDGQVQTVAAGDITHLRYE